MLDIVPHTYVLPILRCESLNGNLSQDVDVLQLSDFFRIERMGGL